MRDAVEWAGDEKRRVDEVEEKGEEKMREVKERIEGK